jgi:two-component system, OmpR family, response regulator ArlR
MNNSILIIEDDKEIREFVKNILVEQRYTVRDTDMGLKGLEIVEKIQPDLVILDLKLPDITGEEVCQRIKKNVPETAVIILTAKDSPSDIAQGLELGADDYISKPFTSEELLARIKARLRDNSNHDSTITIEDLTLNSKKFEVQRGGKKIDLTPQEFKLLETLMVNKNTVLTRDMILSKVWKYSPDIESRVVDVYIGYLRNKIDKGYKKNLIKSVRGFGYVIKDDK